jgi:hypothetical protein
MLLLTLSNNWSNTFGVVKKKLGAAGLGLACSAAVKTAAVKHWWSNRGGQALVVKTRWPNRGGQTEAVKQRWPNRGGLGLACIAANPHAAVKPAALKQRRCSSNQTIWRPGAVSSRTLLVARFAGAYKSQRASGLTTSRSKCWSSQGVQTEVVNKKVLRRRLKRRGPQFGRRAW